MSPRSSTAVKAELFFALGDETRLRIVNDLCLGGAQSIAHLTENTAVTRQAVTKHLRVLHGAGFVRSKRRGREQLWELQPKKVDEARRYLDHISARWDDALARLKLFVEE